MLYTIKNEAMSVTINTLGAELQSITGADGTEYLWYGDADYWRGRATNLFPYVGRMTDGTYIYKGKKYPMGPHGFARNMEFAAQQENDSSVVFTLTDTDDTRDCYPFRFAFSVIYALVGTELRITYRVENKGDDTMYFGLGGHPGFRLPLEEGKRFEDYAITFAQPCHPSRALLAPSYMMSGVEKLYPLENDTTLPLRHDLFDDDAIILRHFDKTMTLSTGEGSRGVRVHIPQMPCVGIWHAVKKEAPFVCIEPWVSLPSRDGVVEDISQQSDLIALPAGKTYENEWSITLL